MTDGWRLQDHPDAVSGEQAAELIRVRKADGLFETVRQRLHVLVDLDSATGKAVLDRARVRVTRLSGSRPWNRA